MTLISMVYGNSYPVIVSDRAISAKDARNRPTLPSTGTQTNLITNIVDFKVKSVIIGDILCVAFAGMEWQIIEAYENVKDYFLYRPINEDNLKNFLDEFPPHQELSVLYALGGPEFSDNKVSVICSGDWAQDHEIQGLDVVAAGSGRAEWIDHLKMYQAYMPSTGDRLSDCQLRALLASVKFIGEEIANEQNLLDNWGAGFDLVYYANGKFQRYDEIVYAFWYYVQETDTIRPLSINHNTYLKDNAVVVNISSEKEPSVFIIPQFRDATPITRDDVVMACKSKDVITCVFIKKADGTRDGIIIPWKEFDPEATPGFLARPYQGTFTHVFKPGYNKILIDSLRKYLE